MFDRAQTTLAAVIIMTLLSQLNTSSSLLSLKTVKRVNSQGQDYDRYLLATSWGGSTCIFHQCTHYGSSEVFNLHGLWPSTAGNSPQDCSTVNFKQQNLNTYLQENLFTYWNSYYHENWEFLDHEIIKHGSCWRPDYGDFNIMNKNLANIIQSYDSSDDYSKINTFLTLTINLSMIINPYKSLKNNGIVPSDSATYDIDTILDIFERENKIKNSVMPVCLAEKSSGKLYLGELRFCIDINFLPIECSLGEINRQLKRCRESPISYPLFPTHK